MLKENDIERLLAHLAKKYDNNLDVLVNNSGTNFNAPIMEHSIQGFAKVINLNLNAVFRLTQALIPMLKREKAESCNDPSKVINITSINGLGVPEFETYAYSASKAGLNHLSKHLANRLACEGILVNNIAPGMFPSRMTRGSIKSFGALIEQTIAVRRTGKPQDIGGVCLFLASTAGNYLCGSTIVVDGGQLINTPDYAQIMATLANHGGSAKASGGAHSSKL